MPTYQYACTQCAREFEQVQSFSDDALTVCPTCQGKLRKVYNAVGVVFKGSGFYRNDSRPAPAGSETPAASSDSPKESSKETKESSKESSKESAAPAAKSKEPAAKTAKPAAKDS